MAVNSFLSVFSLFLIFSVSIVTAQSPNTADTNFTCSKDLPPSCDTYGTYRVRSPYSNFGNISELRGLNTLSPVYGNQVMISCLQVVSYSTATFSSFCHWEEIETSLTHCNFKYCSSVVAFFIALSGVSAYVHHLHKKKRALARNSSSLQTSDLIPTKKVSKDEVFEQKAIQDKLLPGVFG
ncbi:unnamed protein product [Fraxinus pennsylvanica]|uniref:Uncharacterized protein n=1 Tax=Fraxinus pennsylvanica TaxID=56036 RepID=A0AAD1YWS9_9LAMI|nr:unnamed protein product [Fraxinus pennsylvanica]